MEVIDHLGPLHDRLSGIGRAQWIPADLDMSVLAAAHLAAEMVDQHLRAQADAEKRLVLGQRDGEPVGLAPDELILIVGAHGAAEDDGAGVAFQRFWQRVAERRPANVEIEAGRLQHLADAARAGVFLMQDRQDPRPRRGRHLSPLEHRPSCPPSSCARRPPGAS